MTTNDPTRHMTARDRRAWETVEQWKAKRLHPTSRELVPAAWRERAAKATSTAREKTVAVANRAPKADEFAAAFRNALEGLTDTAARAGAATVRREAVLKAYRKHGFDVSSLDDVRKLELDDIRDVKPRLDLGYILASAAQGAGTGLLASGGTIIAAGGAVGTGGVAAAPGAGAIVTAIAADTAATIVASNRAVAHVATYYGYDIDEPGERVFALGALSVGLASDAGKFVAYRELNGIVQALARRQAWQQLGHNQVAAVVKAVYRALGMRLTKKKLAAAVPVVGVAVGAGLNARTLARVVDDAEHVYLERYLRDKYGLELGEPESGEMLGIIEAEIVDGPGDDQRPRRPEE